MDAGSTPVNKADNLLDMAQCGREMWVLRQWSNKGRLVAHEICFARRLYARKWNNGKGVKGSRIV